MEIKELHFSIALQGGGCKGIAYIGAYQAMIEQYKDKFDVKEKIKSIIGSSAGGILALAFCCEMEFDQLVEICTRLGNVPKDDKFDDLDQEKVQRDYEFRT